MSELSKTETLNNPQSFPYPWAFRSRSVHGEHTAMKPEPSSSSRQLSRPEDVHQHLTALRRSQREVGKFVGAVQDLSEQHTQILAKFLASNSECIAGSEMNPRFRDACERLLTRYLELARRRNMTIHPPENCIPVFHELAKELRLNCVAFKLSPDKLATTTLLSEKALRELSQDPILVQFLSRFRGLIDRAVESNPADPHGYLHDLHFRFSTCAEHETRHQSLPLTGNTLLFLAKTLRNLDPLVRLALFRAELKSLLETTEFQPLLGIFATDSARSRFIERVLTRFKEEDCRPYLRKTLKLYREIANDSSFAQLQSRRADILVAVFRQGAKAKEFLATMLAQEARIAQLAEQCGERLTAKDIRVLCLRAPRKASQVEAELSQRSAGNKGELR